MSSQILSNQRTQSLEAWVRLLRGHATAVRAANAQLVADYGLTINDYEALLHLSRAENRSLRRVDLAGQLLLTASGVTRLLDGLERAGYVEKGTCASDARVTYAVLTEAGRQKLEEASLGHVAAVRKLFEERYTGEELATLAELLDRLPGAAGGDGSDCAAG
jgi:DNA-binding MarR family transcriptional regulator